MANYSGLYDRGGAFRSFRGFPKRFLEGLPVGFHEDSLRVQVFQGLGFRG